MVTAALIHNSQITKETQMPINRQQDTEIMEYILNEVLLNYLKRLNSAFWGKGDGS